MLAEMLRIYRYRQFGHQSEKIVIDQLSIFDEAALPKNVETIAEADEVIHVPAHTQIKQRAAKHCQQIYHANSAFMIYLMQRKHVLVVMH